MRQSCSFYWLHKIKKCGDGMFYSIRTYLQNLLKNGQPGEKSGNHLLSLYIWLYVCMLLFSFCGAATQRGSWLPHSRGFLDHTRRRTTVGRTPLDEWSARRRDLNLTTHNTHNRQTFMPPVGFKPTIWAGERPQTYTLDRAAAGTDMLLFNLINYVFLLYMYT
jgi:hypothetical protein